MGYPRRTADLVTQNNIFVDISNDRVGIGTDQPTVKLEVVGDAAISGNLNVAGVLTYEDVTNIDSVGLITARSGMVVSGVSTFQGNVFLGSNDGLYLGDNNDLLIYNDGSNSIFRSPNDTIWLQSDVNVNITKNNAAEIIAQFTPDGSVSLYYNNSKKFETTTSGITVTGSVNATSDLYLKENIQPVKSALEIVNQLEGVRFDWKDSGESSLGVIAQDLEKVLPELVSETDGVKSVNYNGIIAVLIQAIKELSQK